MASRDAAANPFEDVFDFGHRELGWIDYPERRLDSCDVPTGWYGGPSLAAGTPLGHDGHRPRRAGALPAGIVAPVTRRSRPGLGLQR